MKLLTALLIGAVIGIVPAVGADLDDNVQHHHHHTDIGRRDPNDHNFVRRIIDDDDHRRLNEYDNLSAARLRLSADGL
ncbi:MAG TPA: hypothetical protein VGP63_04990 [Planctomycetaceae bacterium]|jgi:hypothetical protein|nr:hypothetical protein [Planctomycetaceae bacterium]